MKGVNKNTQHFFLIVLLIVPLFSLPIDHFQTHMMHFRSKGRQTSLFFSYPRIAIYSNSLARLGKVSSTTAYIKYLN